MTYFSRLGRLRREQEPLRLGDIQFFTAEDRHLGYTRTYQGKTVKVYVNRNSDPWDIPAGNVVFGCNLQILAPDWLSLAPKGFCLVAE